MAQHPTLMNPNLLRLVFCQLVSVSGTVLVITLGGIVGGALAGDPRLATLPMSLMVVGTACGTIPAALLMRRIGRRAGFLIGLTVAALGMGLGILALQAHSFVLFCLGTSLVGLSLAASQQYRFAAAESVGPAQVSQAVSVVLIGSIGGALIGPELAKLTGQDIGSFARPMWVAMALYAAGMVALLGFRGAASPGGAPEKAAGGVGAMLRQRLLITAVAGGVVGQGVMTLIMTATPISMHVVDGFSMPDTANVIRNHVLAMYLPSLVSGWLIAQLGVGRIMWIGILVMLATVGIGLMGHAYLHYSLSMIALGVAWNFLFVGGTTLLVRAQQDGQEFTAQAFNDFCVFGGSALASLAAGAVLHSIGWEALLITGLPVVAVLAGLLFSVRKDARIR